MDASALLAYLGGEPGADVAEGALADASICVAANGSETAQKLRAAGRDWSVARGLLLSLRLRIEPVTEDDAEHAAAAMWTRGTGLSLGDRPCLALGRRVGAVVLTADRSWGVTREVRQIR